MRTMFPCCRLVVVALILVLAAGCGPTLYEAHGTVTLGGTPVPNAQLLFVPDTKELGSLPARTAADGSYSVMLPPGDYTVRILAQKKIPAPTPQAGGSGGMITELTVDIIPPKYNTESELRANISGPSQLDFPLKSS